MALIHDFTFYSSQHSVGFRGAIAKERSLESVKEVDVCVSNHPSVSWEGAVLLQIDG